MSEQGKVVNGQDLTDLETARQELGCGPYYLRMMWCWD